MQRERFAGRPLLTGGGTPRCARPRFASLRPRRCRPGPDQGGDAPATPQRLGLPPRAQAGAHHRRPGWRRADAARTWPRRCSTAPARWRKSKIKGNQIMPGKPGPSHPDEIGRWSKEKLELLAKYLHAYSVIMAKQRERWLHAYHYVDAFAGAVQHRSKSAGLLAPQMTAQSSLLGSADADQIAEEATEAYVNGSPIRALETTPPFDVCWFIDLAPWRVDRLGELAARFPIGMFVFDQETAIVYCARRSRGWSPTPRSNVLSCSSIHMACRSSGRLCRHWQTRRRWISSSTSRSWLSPACFLGMQRRLRNQKGRNRPHNGQYRVDRRAIHF